MNFKLFFESTRLSAKEKLQKRIEAEEHFPVLDAYEGLKGRGYLLTNGDILSIGEDDHRSINLLYMGDLNNDNFGDIRYTKEKSRDKYSNSNAMLSFMTEMGAIRFHNTSGDLIMSYVKIPTSKQLLTILKTRWDEINIDKYSELGQNMKHFEGDAYCDYEVDKFLRSAR